MRSVFFYLRPSDICVKAHIVYNIFFICSSSIVQTFIQYLQSARRQSAHNTKWAVTKVSTVTLQNRSEPALKPHLQFIQGLFSPLSHESISLADQDDCQFSPFILHYTTSCRLFTQKPVSEWPHPVQL